jgi:hypothetical protein
MPNDWSQAPWSPRDWQAQALDAAKSTIGESRPVIRAVTGAGKSGVIAELCWQCKGSVVVTTPTKKLVEDLASTIREWGVSVGRFYTDAKQTHHRVVVCCNDSLPTLADRIDPPDLWICDEAHKSECDTVHDVILGPEDEWGERDEEEAWRSVHRIGFTATPYRADQSEELSLFDELAYDYGPAEAMKDGVVVPPRVRHYQGTATELDDACVEMIERHALDEGPGVVDALNIRDAESFADLLQSEGIEAKAVHSKMHDRTVERQIRRLRDEKLDCLVHVQMLSEGVDLPWLRWLCCRRPISSRVLFAQYVGRGLRTYEDKDYCLVLDPQDLFGQLSLDYEAILAGGRAEDDEGIPDLPALELDWTVEDLEESDGGAQETLEGVPVQVVDPATSYVRRLRLAFQSMGLAPMTIGDRDWRDMPVTQQQLSKIEELSWVWGEPDVPETHARALQIAIDAAPACDRGTASDLISCLEVIRCGWPDDVEGEVDAEGVAA